MVWALSGLSKPKKRIVKLLGELDEYARPYDPDTPVTSEDLRKALGMKCETVSRNLRGLIKIGLVEKRPAGRQRDYSLTVEGRKHFEAVDWEEILEHCWDVPTWNGNRDILTELGIHIVRDDTARSLVCECPFCPSDNEAQPSLMVDRDTRWCCSGGCEPGRGHGITLVAQVKHISNAEALSWMYL